ncbi:ABC transporter permease [Alkalihalobacillus hemicellulosilyticus]|uniref:ABC transporter permease n=1 Tax=Halalkalibacter hemicellulosilyticusJCM 9152 TaxID=1236971 RepID=W4QEP4_9BACI|nr:ABC transporter permease subunit [Halalkalibacter hemicellulosilyticus]GAE30555.1 hypothetical protein JCM9152_1965 [Halalkalibacter hemicellulosilyticusJCM 9152]
MRTFWILFKKEMVESMKNGKWIWLPITLIILGISQPITTYFMPQILEMAGNLPEGTVIELPTPTGEEVLSGVLSQYGTIGTLLFILASMGMIAHERRSGVLTLIMARPVYSIQYIMSKFAAQSFLLIVSLFFGYALSWYYTNLLFSTITFQAMISSFMIYSVWVLIVIATTTFVSTVLKQAGGIAGVSVILLGTMGILSTLLPKYMEWSPGNISNEAMLLINETSSSNLWFVSLSSVILIAILLMVAIVTFNRLESYHQADF